MGRMHVAAFMALACAGALLPADAFAEGCLQKFSCQLYGECRLPCLDELTGSAPAAPPSTVAGTTADALVHGRAVAKDDAKSSDPARSKRRVAHHIAPKIKAPQLVASKGVTSLAELAGKPVSFGPPGSPAQKLGRQLFAKLDIKVRETPLEVDNALDGVATGDVAAVLVVKPTDVARVEKMPAPGVHELPVPASAEK